MEVLIGKIPAKQKAELLVGECMTIDIHDQDHYIIRRQSAKNYALFAVDEIIKSLNHLFGTTKELAYYQQVKLEIQNL
jgi:hypothetical protein